MTLSSSTVSEAPAAPRNRGRIVRYIAFVLIVSAVPISLLVRRVVNPVHRVDPRNSGSAPAFALRALDGQTVSLAALRGQPVVVNFWGAWCEQCTRQLPLLVELRQRHPGLPVVGILFRESPEAGDKAAQDAGADWPVLVDPDGKVAAAYGVDGAPATFFIRPDGTISGYLIGPVSIGLLDKQTEKIIPSG